MTPDKILFLFPVLGAFFLFRFLRARLKKPSAASVIWKSLTSVCFLAVAFCAVWKHPAGTAGAGFAMLVLIGLFFGLLGDIWLDLKWNCPEDDVRYTFAGFWCFAIGHVFFLCALTGTAPALRWVVLPLIPAAVLGIVIGLAGRLLKVDYGRFRNITMLYAALLLGTTLVSGSLLLQACGRSLSLMLMFIGAVLFLISDLILSGTYFGTGKDRPADIVSNHIFYYAAQFLIAAAAFTAV